MIKDLMILILKSMKNILQNQKISHNLITLMPIKSKSKTFKKYSKMKPFLIEVAHLFAKIKKLIIIKAINFFNLKTPKKKSLNLTLPLMKTMNLANGKLYPLVLLLILISLKNENTH
jgi:hypothetical protein